MGELQKKNINKSEDVHDDEVIPTCEDRLSKAFDQIENIFNEKLSQLRDASSDQNTDIILANLDILITRVKDILFQVERSEK